MELSGVTVWASLGSARLHQVELPSEVKEVHVFVDNDEPGRLAARRAAERSYQCRAPGVSSLTTGRMWRLE